MTRIALLAAFVAVAVLGCGPRPSRNAPPTAAEATGRDACSIDAEGRASPLIVDLMPEQRSDIEVALRRGLSVVRFDCPTLEVLPRCSVEGGYAYAGTAPKQQLVRMADEQTIRATLPLTGNALAARLGGELERGKSLDLALVMVGKLTATRAVMSTDELRGDCAGATHVVHSATLGAFALSTGSRSAERGVAEVFGAGVEASSAQSKSVSTRDGALERCASAASADAAAPEGCNAALRLELLPVAAPPPPIAVLGPEQAESFRGKFCPDPETCRSGCDAGDATACSHWGVLLAVGDRVPRDLGRSTAAFQRACELDDMTACTLLGIALLTRGNPRADAERGRRMLERPCERGLPDACTTLGISYSNSGDHGRAEGYFRRACDLGDREACSRLGR